VTWSVEVPDDIAGSLERALDAATAGEIEFLVSFTNGFKIEIFADEHPPPHFHVEYKQQKNTFRITDGAPMHGDELSRHFRIIRKWHAANRKKLIQRWNETRPADCPVGPIVE
jgi:hypothetical protein